MPNKTHVDFNLLNISKTVDAIPDAPELSVEDARHQQMMDKIAPYAKKVRQKNMTDIDLEYSTRDSSVMLIMCPEWAPEFPPFSLARLSGICKQAGYACEILDLNVKTHNIYRNDWQPNKKIPFRLWDPSASWHWLGETYMKDIHPLLEPILTEAIDHIIDKNPTLVGFSEYYISEEPTKWMVRELKRRAPHIKTAVGGPNVHKDWFNNIPEYDFVVVGEGERAILRILEQLENFQWDGEQQILKQDTMERIDINDMPMPDYTGLDFNEYRVPNGVTSEFSRGCTAKCTFCEETHFWKYRQRQATDVIREAEWLYYNKGTDIMWFIDSLVNGNVNELRAFSLGLKAKEIPMRWTGYARCDGRMDEEYFRDISGDGGCIMLNFGCESGSQKVLNDMAKGVTIKEMEDNFDMCKKYNVAAATNWIVGFPTEEHDDFAKTMLFLWRNRNKNINNVGAGVGMAVGPETIVGQNPDKYNVGWHKYQNHWIRKDFTMGGTHVMHRVKLFHMFLDFMTGCTDAPFGYPVRFNLRTEHYGVEFSNPDKFYEVDYEDFDYDIIKIEENPFANTLVNEIWPFLRVLWLARGGYKIEIAFNPEIDLKEFGSQFGPGMFNGVYKFFITDSGVWSANFEYDFKQIENPYDDRNDDDRGAFYAQDYSRMQSNAAKRARKLAKPTWDTEAGRSDDDFGKLITQQASYNNSVDFSFNHKYRGSGKWQRNSHVVDVPDEITSGVNSDNKHLGSKAEFYRAQDIISAVNIDTEQQIKDE